MCMVAGYCRVSTETQAEKGFGLDTQETQIRRYCKEHGLTLEKIFVDAGISGAIGDTADNDAINKRTGLIDMLSGIKDGGTVIVLNTSRLWRDDNSKVLIRRELMRHQVKIISIEQPQFDLYATNPNDFLVNGMMELLDQWERLSISLKLAKGRTTKAKGGDKPAGVLPMGYQYSADKKHVVVNENEAEIVKRIFSESLSGKSLAKIADGLNSEGIQTRQGKTWTAGSLSVILHNRFYIGELTHNGKSLQGNHKPIISKVTFGKIRAQLEKRQRNKAE